MKQREKDRLINEGYDLHLIEKTQPQGNVSFKETYSVFGDGVAACLDVMELPSHGMPDYWLRPLVTNDDTLTVLSVGTENTEEIMASLARSTQEKASQISGNNSLQGNMEANNDTQDNMALLQDLMQNNLVMKRLYIRIYVYADDLTELTAKIKKIKKDIGKFRVWTLPGEQDAEWQSMFTPTMLQESLPGGRKGIPISLRDLGGGLPFDHVKLDDPFGNYYGYTSTSGAVNFDFYRRDQHRTASFMMVLGAPGMGKSTFQKMVEDDGFMRGNFIRNFDVSNEYRSMTTHYGGVLMDLAGGQYKNNPFEIFPTMTNFDGTTVDKIGSMNNHFAKLQSIFECENPSATPDDQMVLQQLLSQFYIDFGQSRHAVMWSMNPERDYDLIKNTGLRHEEYPVLSDFVTALDSFRRSQEYRTVSAVCGADLQHV
ncbi:hypothetical protein [Furfurilactobacillus entadae]|uniref:hypothetical protein n=1 Tax=Furfurilactobacillus entadae TaxID=2922307 RepID=UPI0035EDF320